MKILIIGSKGFIGSYLSKYFDAHGQDVWQSDVVETDNELKYTKINSFNSDYSDLFKQCQFDVCINCSGAASVPDSILHPYRDFILNSANVFAMLSALHKFNSGCKFINLSSAAVYGNPDLIPVKEDAPLSPISPYGRHKVIAEEILKEFHEEFGERTCNLRIFSVFGAGLKKQLFWDLFNKMESSNSIELFGTGEESRDFINVKDLAKVIDITISRAPFAGEAINVANGVQTTIKSAVNLFASLYGYQGTISFSGQTRQGDPRFWEADISTLKEWGYQASISLGKGLSDYITWAKENI